MVIFGLVALYRTANARVRRFNKNRKRPEILSVFIIIFNAIEISI